MAQLKVIVQSLSRLHHEPKAFLTAINKVVSANLDGKSFITMSYGVIDIERRVLARAVDHVLETAPGNCGASARARCRFSRAGPASSRSVWALPRPCQPRASWGASRVASA